MIGRLILAAIVMVAAVYGYPDESQVGKRKPADVVAGAQAGGR